MASLLATAKSFALIRFEEIVEELWTVFAGGKHPRLSYSEAQGEIWMLACGDAEPVEGVENLESARVFCRVERSLHLERKLNRCRSGPVDPKQLLFGKAVDVDGVETHLAIMATCIIKNYAEVGFAVR